MMKADLKPFLDHLPEPLYTIFYFAVKLELLVIAFFWYIISVKFFGLEIGLQNISCAIVLAYFPFLSYIFYQLRKRRRQYISHYLAFWYEPLLYIPSLLVIAWVLHNQAMLASPFAAYAVLIIGISLSHFAGAIFLTPRGISLFPFPGRLTVIPSVRILTVSQVKKYDKDFIDKYHNDNYGYSPWNRSWHEELESRSSQIYRITPILLAILIILAMKL